MNQSEYNNQYSLVGNKLIGMYTWCPPVLKQTWRRWCGHASSSTLYTKFVLTVSQIICYGPINHKPGLCQIILAHCIVCNFACVHVHPWRKVNYLYQLACFSEYQLATYFVFFFNISDWSEPSWIWAATSWNWYWCKYLLWKANGNRLSLCSSSD